MINITKKTVDYNINYNPNFKGKVDYSEIYKEMEKLSLRREQKIIPKLTIKDKLLNITKFRAKDRFSANKTTLEDKFTHRRKSPIRKKLKRWIHSETGEVIRSFISAVTAALTLCCSSIYLSLQLYRCCDNDKEDLEQNLVTKSDSLESLLKDKAISFDEYRNQINDAIEE